MDDIKISHIYHYKCLRSGQKQPSFGPIILCIDIDVFQDKRIVIIEVTLVTYNFNLIHIEILDFKYSEKKKIFF